MLKKFIKALDKTYGLLKLVDELTPCLLLKPKDGFVELLKKFKKNKNNCNQW